MASIKKNQGDIVFDFINHLLLVIVMMLTLYPLVFVISASVSDTMLVMQGKVWLWPKGFNLSAYRAVFNDSAIMTGYKNTFIYTITGTAINVAMTVAGAYPLSRKDFIGRNAITFIFTFQMFFSGGLIPTYIIYRKLGLYNNIWVMILPGAVAMWNLVIMRTFFQSNIPGELQEAAVIDGCSNMGILFRIVLPLSKAIIAVMVIFYGVGHWNQFFRALIYLKDKERYPLQLILREILIQHNVQEMVSSESTMYSQQLLAEGLKYAIIIVSSVPVLLLYPFLQKYFVKGVMIGAIKG